MSLESNANAGFWDELLHKSKIVAKRLLRERAIAIAVCLPVRAVLRSSLAPPSLKNFMAAQIAARIPLSAIDQFAIFLPNGKAVKLGRPSDSSVAHFLFWYGFQGRESETTPVFCVLARKAKVILDIGANVGFYTLLAAGLNPGSRVVAFEPVPDVYKQLEHNIRLNSFSNVLPVQVAVADSNGYIPLYVNRLSDQSASILKRFRQVVSEIKVPCVTVDSFVERNQIRRIDLMKIDVEGADAKVLEGAQGVLARDGPDIICEVLLGDNVYGVADGTMQKLLAQFGYRSYWITGGGLVQCVQITGHNDARNYLFTKKELRDIGLNGLFRGMSLTERQCGQSRRRVARGVRSMAVKKENEEGE